MDTNLLLFVCTMFILLALLLVLVIRLAISNSNLKKERAELKRLNDINDLVVRFAAVHKLWVTNYHADSCFGKLVDMYQLYVHEGAMADGSKSPLVLVISKNTLGKTGKYILEFKLHNFLDYQDGISKLIQDIKALGVERVDSVIVTE